MPLHGGEQSKRRALIAFPRDPADRPAAEQMEKRSGVTNTYAQKKRKMSACIDNQTNSTKLSYHSRDPDPAGLISWDFLSTNIKAQFLFKRRLVSRFCPFDYCTS